MYREFEKELIDYEDYQHVNLIDQFFQEQIVFVHKAMIKFDKYLIFYLILFVYHLIDLLLIYYLIVLILFVLIFQYLQYHVQLNLNHFQNYFYFFHIVEEIVLNHIEHDQ
jgi:hypothetical protein